MEDNKTYIEQILDMTKQGKQAQLEEFRKRVFDEIESAAKRGKNWVNIYGDWFSGEIKPATAKLLTDELKQMGFSADLYNHTDRMGREITFYQIIIRWAPSNSAQKAG